MVGKTFEDASAILQKAGFPAQQGDSRYSKSVAANIVLQEDPPDVTQLNSEVDDDAKRILMKMIARNRDERYQTCHELIADVEEYLAARNVRSFTSSLATRSTPAFSPRLSASVWCGATTGTRAVKL